MFGTSQLHDHWDPPDTAESRSLLDELTTTTRLANQAAARRLRVVGELFEMRRAERGEAADWAVDTWAAVGAEIAAALRISLGKAGSYLRYGLAMNQLPAVSAAFESGDIDEQTFATIVFRTGLVTDEDAIAELDRRLAARISRWPSMTKGRLIGEIDRAVGAVDPDAVRRVRERARDRDVTVWEATDGLSDISGRLMATDAQLLDKRLDTLAATVCPDDPRTKDQRRADALGALAGGAERLMCRCGKPDCPAAAATPSPVVIHVVADQSTLDGRSERPAYLLGADALISAELLREIAAAAKVRPLIHPTDVPAEPGYRPSRALADFVRARDLTCRAPGCDRPATECDLDHTVPYAAGGDTHASNIKCLCRFHHLLKTFWGWRDTQLPDGTVIWTLPGGQSYVTTPGSALLFPTLSAPTPAAPASPAGPSPQRERSPGGRSVMMPRRPRSRASSRSQQITAERMANRRLREAAAKPGDDPPPF